MAREQVDLVQPIELFAATYHYETVEAAQLSWRRMSEESQNYYRKLATKLNRVRHPREIVDIPVQP